MVVHSKDETLMCKVFPSSLGPMTMRWFDGLRADSIDSFKELSQAFGSRLLLVAGFLGHWIPYCPYSCERKRL